MPDDFDGGADLIDGEAVSEQLNMHQELVDESLDVSLRPQRIEEFIGQQKLKQHLEILIKAAQGRNEPVDHVLFYGPPGLGKTTLANIMAQELGVNLRTTSGPALERSGDLAAILTNLQEGDILFIDEIHRLRKVIEETLYPAMEDFYLDIVIGKGPSARSLKLDLPRFTIIGATTMAGHIAAPLRDRFGGTYKLEYYDAAALAQVISRSSRVLGVEIDQQAALSLGQRSRGTPRIANKLLKRVRDLAQVRQRKIINEQLVEEALTIFEIDSLGLDATDRQLLTAMAQHYDGGPVGLETLATSISEDKRTLEQMVEPYLLQIGFLKRTPRGRQLTPSAYKHLGIEL